MEAGVEGKNSIRPWKERPWHGTSVALRRLCHSKPLDPGKVSPLSNESFRKQYESFPGDRDVTCVMLHNLACVAGLVEIAFQMKSDVEGALVAFASEYSWKYFVAIGPACRIASG